MHVIVHILGHIYTYTSPHMTLNKFQRPEIIKIHDDIQGK